jgi:hypothetical protein
VRRAGRLLTPHQQREMSDGSPREADALTAHVTQTVAEVSGREGVTHRLRLGGTPDSGGGKGGTSYASCCLDPGLVNHHPLSSRLPLCVPL